MKYPYEVHRNKIFVMVDQLTQAKSVASYYLLAFLKRTPSHHFRPFTLQKPIYINHHFFIWWYLNLVFALSTTEQQWVLTGPGSAEHVKPYHTTTVMGILISRIRICIYIYVCACVFVSVFKIVVSSTQYTTPVILSFSTVSCPAGKYLKTDTDCQPCPKDHYQDQAQQTSCKPCTAPNSVTSGTGSSSAQDCGK